MARRRKEEVGQRDRDDLRGEVSRATARIIAERGLESVRLRQICAELGYSTHIVSHYFESKKEMVLFTLRQCAARQVARLKAAIGRGGDLAECLEALMPLDAERLIDARVWMVFWAETSDPEIAGVQQDFGARWRRLLIGTMRMRGYFRPGMTRAKQDFIAQRLQTAVAGIGIHGALGIWPPKLQREHLQAELASVLASFEGSAPVSTAEMVTPVETADPSTRKLVIENTRLRKMLIDAMLQIETLTEAQSPSIVRLAPPAKDRTGDMVRR